MQQQQQQQQQSSRGWGQYGFWRQQQQCQWYLLGALSLWFADRGDRVMSLSVLEPWPTVDVPCLSIQATDCAEAHLQMQCRDKFVDYTLLLDHDAFATLCTAHCDAPESFSWTLYCAGVSNSGLRISPFLDAPVIANATQANCARPLLLYTYQDCTHFTVSIVKHPNSTTSAWVSLTDPRELVYLSTLTPEFSFTRTNHSTLTYTVFPTQLECLPFSVTATTPTQACPVPVATPVTSDTRNDAQLVVGVFYFATCVMYFLMSERLWPAFVFAGFATFANLYLPNTTSREIFFLSFLFAIPLQLLLVSYHWLQGGVAKLRIPDLRAIPKSSIVLFAFGVVQITVSYYGH